MSYLEEEEAMTKSVVDIQCDLTWNGPQAFKR
jgi:hypothetical protein